MHRPSRCPAFLLLIGALTLPPAIATAQPSVADKETARALVIDGRAKLTAKDYEGARKAFQAAHEIMGVPTTGLDLAKALDGLGLLIEARATALEVSRIPQKPSEPQAYTDARAAAATLAEQLAGRIPAIVISVKGTDAKATPSVTVDGTALSLSMLTLPRKINPGAHIIVASAPGYATERRDVTLKEGETTPVEITLAQPVAAKPAPDKPPPALPPPAPEPPRAAPEPIRPAATTTPLATTPPAPVASEGLSHQRIAGIALAASGLVGLGLGGVMGAIAISRNSGSNADGHCNKQNFCDTTGTLLRAGSIQAADESSMFFLIGGLSFAAGGIIFLTAPSQPVKASVGFGPGSISVVGRW